MTPTLAARLLRQSLFAVLCGAAACQDSEPRADGLGSRIGQAGNAGATSNEAGSAGSAVEAPAGAGGAIGTPGGASGVSACEGGSSAGPAGGAGAAGGTVGAAGASGGAAGGGENGLAGAGAGGERAGAGGGTAGAGGPGLGGTSGAGTGGMPGGFAGAGAGGAPSGLAGSGGAFPRCDEPAAILVNGAPSGMVKCADGSLIRPTATKCRLRTEPPDPFCSMGGNQGVGGFENGRHLCETFCETDADCGGTAVCACRADGVGVCAPGECGTSADCAAGRTCRLGVHVYACWDRDPRMWCVGPDDECTGDPSCHDGGPYVHRWCGRRDFSGKLRCASLGAAGCGRPILLAEEAVVAPLTRGLGEWSHGPIDVS